MEREQGLGPWASQAFYFSLGILDSSLVKWEHNTHFLELFKGTYEICYTV